ncbi:DUF445 domain-containing protein [Sporosarcina cyprini]|uniref:DUF445 domain-containing protein n=1 Tax=Sporosarcina cyprini TaxID=2910523 RepID=UPI001EDE095C|nr:DUF445 family protein [Sporosarcina cyprini]MCG3088686.1 DUF445 family protein [Sporosarcina cyprini]
MNFIWTLLFMAVIGALIGGFTNHLAIKMLFRPHEPKYIGSWRVPFTPGLIPKRRDELAKQLGKTVTNYLLTPETFRKKLLTAEMETKAEQFVQRKLDEHILQSDKTLNDWLAVAGASEFAGKAEEKVMAVMDGQLASVRRKLMTGTVEEVVPAQWLQQASGHLPTITNHILQSAENYIDSYEGKVMFQKLINDFLESKGTFGGMLNMLFGDSNSLVEKVQREALKFVTAPGTYNLVHSLLEKEWNKLTKRPMEELIGNFDWDGLFISIKAYAKRELAIEARMDKTLAEYWPSGSDWTSAHITPKLVGFAFDQAEKQLEASLSRLKLDEIVREQVDSFPVAVLEDLVLGISRREFKMITVLGALLGGLIGIVQGLIVFFTT